MPRYAANLTMMFNEWAFLDRFAAAADAGFDDGGVPAPYDHPPGGNRASPGSAQPPRRPCSICRLAIGPTGERGLAALPEARAANSEQSVAKALDYARGNRRRTIAVCL